MDLDLDDTQQMLVDSIGSLLDKQAAPEDVRAAEPLGFDPVLWASLGDLGLVPMAVAEDAGGWGASVLDLSLVSECLGRRCVPAPVIEAQVAARALARLGSPRVAEVLDGGVATVALHPAVHGVARAVPAGAVADLVIARRADDVVLVADAPAPPQVGNLADLPLADVDLGDATALASGAGAAAVHDAAVDDWLLLTAGALVGLAESALGLAVDYAKQRHAFGSPIGSFQGIAHPLADVATRVEGARLLVREAAWSVDAAHADAGERACSAFAFASEVARQSTYWGVHTLGGYGVMDEYDAQLYFRRARGWAGVFGDSDAAYRRSARHRYGPRGS